MVKILVVDDDATLCEMLQLNLELEGWQADVARSAEEALTLDLASYDLLLLDVMMGPMSGFRMAQTLRNNPTTASVPVIFCTARDTEDDMLTGLNLGADDYIYKPYTLRNVIARIKAVLRRAAKRPQQPETAPSLTYRGIVLDPTAHTCTVDGSEVALVKKEYGVLELMMRNPGRVFTRDELLRAVWGDDVVVLDRTIDVNIARIRHKIAPYCDCILTRSGYGYGLK